MRARSYVVGSLFLTLAVAGHACGGSGGSGGSGAGASTGTGAHGGSGGGGTGASDAGDEGLFANHGKLVSLTVTPPMATIDITNGAAPPAVFQAIGTFEDSFTGPVDADWSFD